MTLQLIPAWRAAHRFWSIRAASLLVLLTTLQLVTSRLEDSGQFARLVGSAGYEALVALLALSVPVLRLLQQRDVFVDGPTSSSPSPVLAAAATDSTDLRGDREPSPLPDAPHERIAFPERPFMDGLERLFGPKPIPTPPPTTKEPEMSMHSDDWQSVFDELPVLVKMAESFFPAKGAGAQKASAVINAVTHVLPAAVPVLKAPDGATKLQKYIAIAVAMMNSAQATVQMQQATNTTVTNTVT